MKWYVSIAPSKVLTTSDQRSLQRYSQSRSECSFYTWQSSPQPNGLQSRAWHLHAPHLLFLLSMLAGTVLSRL